MAEPRVAWLALALGALVLVGASCEMSEKKLAKLREESLTFEVIGSSRVFDRKNVYGDPIGLDAARVTATRQATERIQARLIFGQFRLAKGAFDFHDPLPPKFQTRVVEQERKGDVYQITYEVFVPEQAFPRDPGCIRTTRLYEETVTEDNRADPATQTENRALAAFVQQAARVRYRRDAKDRKLSGDVWAIITREETLANRRLVEVKGVVRFEEDRPVGLWGGWK